HDVDGGVRQRDLLGGAGQHAHVGELTRATASQLDQRGMRLDPDDLRRLPGEERQVEPCAAAQVEDGAGAPRRGLAQRLLEVPVRVDGPVLDLVRCDVVPDVRTRANPFGRPSPPGGQILTIPLGVWMTAAMMPGMPLGATHSTLTSSSGRSTGSPSHSLTRCGSPAISMAERETPPSAPALGCNSSPD